MKYQLFTSPRQSFSFIIENGVPRDRAVLAPTSLKESPPHSPLAQGTSQSQFPNLKHSLQYIETDPSVSMFVERLASSDILSLEMSVMFFRRF